MEDKIDINLLLQQAIDETRKVHIRAVFLLKDLFKGYEWDRIPIKYRIMLGNLFLDYIRKNELLYLLEKRRHQINKNIKKLSLMKLPIVRGKIK